MVHQHFVATILTILLVGTVPTSLISYSDSGLGINIFSNHNFSYAVQNIQTENNNNNDSGNSERSDISQSETSDTSMLQEKVKELILKANTAKTKAAKAINAANNATEKAVSLSSAADEADKDVKQVLKSNDDEDTQKQDRNETETKENDKDNNDEVNAALNELKEKRKAANLAEEEARGLSDKADSLIKATKKAEKLAEAALKELENAKNELSNSNQKRNREGDNAAVTATENEDANKKKAKANNNSENDSMHKKSDKIQSDITPPGVDKAGSLNKKNHASIENNSRVDVIQTLDNRSKDTQGKESGPTLNEILAQAEKNSQLMRFDQSRAASVVNNSISAIEDQNRDGSTEVTREVNSSTSVNRASVLAEIIKQISNVTDSYPSNNEAVTNSSKINPISINDNATANSSSTNKSATTEYEGMVDCNVIPDNATIADDNSGLSIIGNMQDNGNDGGCYPQTSTSGEFDYLVWSEGDEDNRYILFKRSVNNKEFEDAITLSGSVPSAVFDPKVTSEGNNVYVVWQGDSESGNQDILMRKSEDNGKSFGDLINLSNDRAGSGNPEINVNSSSVYVVWDGTTPGNNDIYFRKSINNGADFDKVRNLSTDGGISYEPKVVVDEKGLEIYWREYRNGHEEVLAKKSLNEGRTFEILQKLEKDVLDLWKDRSMSASRS
jgi:hypothetical protein